MADTGNRSNGRKSNSAKKAAETRKKNAQERLLREQKEVAKKKMLTEVYLWISVAVAIFLFLSNFKVCGIVGGFLRSVMMGLFGSMGYLFPIILVITVGLIAYNRMNSNVASKVIGMILLFLDGCIFFHMFAYGDSKEKITFFYKAGSEGSFGGGILGGMTGQCLHSLLGLVGAYIVAFVILIISIVLLTEKSLMSEIKSRGKNAYENAKEESRYRKEQNELEKEQQREERTRRREWEKERVRAVGVNFGDTKIDSSASEGKNKKDNRQDVHEIHIEGLDEPWKENIPKQDETSYTYNDVRGDKHQIKIEGFEETKPPVNDEHATDGEFQPKERIIVSKEAKEAMSRKPYGMTSNTGTTASNAGGQTADSLMKEQENLSAEVQKRASNEGKIIAPQKKKMKYKKPGYNLLKDNPGSNNQATKAGLMQTANKLKEVLANFGVNVEVTNVSKGPSVTRYELQPEMGTKVSRITGLADDIKLNMAAADIRIEAPIPGKAAVGIEIPNEGRDSVYLKELLMTKELRDHKSKLAFPAGKDIAGRVVVADIAKMPHMLIAGTTGSGKSVFTNSILMSILYRTTPEDVRVIIIDPKVVEFQVYNKIPHLLYDVVTDPKKAAGILNWAVAEMTTRYKKFANAGARDIASYNAKIASGELNGEEVPEKMPQILIIIDELADLMMVAAKEVEEAICRLAQLARAAGIHMVIATQRPSVDVITGLIKANIPSRVALTVASGTDSRTIIDMNGAEKLLGNGDMLFYPAGYVKPVRLQGAYVSDQEILNTVNFIKDNSGEAEYDDTIDAKLTTDQEAMSNGGENDPYFEQAGRMCIEKQKGSTSMIQRQFKVGFNRAARIMEQLYDAGVVGQEEVNKPRKVIMSMEEFDRMIRGGE